jgi:pimeloyl-ACP methyl ester carboxylesterase
MCSSGWCTYVNPQRVRVSVERGASTPWLELVRRSVPTAQIFIISGAGHFVMLEKPQAVNERLEQFVTRLSRPA